MSIIKTGLRFSCAGFLAFTVASATAQEPPTPWQDVQEAFHSGNRFDIPSIIADPTGDAATVTRYFDVELALYWEGRDLPAAVYVGEQGIAYCLSRAAVAPATDRVVADRLKGVAGRIAFNLASATWPGWDQPEIDISEEQRDLGFVAARLALSISEELKSSPGALANGNWMVGAHQLAAGQFSEAAESFDKAALLARAAKDRGMELTSEGFAALADIAGRRDPDKATDRLDQARSALEREVEDPDFWTVQLDTAYRVFAPPVD